MSIYRSISKQKSNNARRNALLFMLPVLLVLALFSATVHAQSQLAGEGDNMLSLSQVYVSPTPIIAGNNINVSFRLFNSYSSELSDVNLGLTSESPIINVSPSNTYLINAIGSGTYGGLGYNLFTYSFHLPSTLSSGEYTIDVVANYRVSVGTPGIDVPGESIMPITFYVHGKPNIGINMLPTSQITPGSEYTYQLEVVNSGGATARNVTVKILGSNSLMPVGESTFSMGSVSQGVPVQASGSMEVSRYASSGINEVPALISYSSSTGNYSYKTNISINLYVGVPDLSITATGSVPSELYSGANATVSLDVQNVGDGMARNVSINLGNGRGLSVDSSANRIFIGSLPPGMSVPEEVFVSSNSSYIGNATINAHVSYLNADYSNSTTAIIPINLSIAPSAVFNITSVKGSLVPGAAYSKIVFTIKNTGNEQAQGITASLQSIYPLSPIAGTTYINSLSPGQSTNATFYVSVSATGSPGQYPVTVYEQWKQPNAANSQQFEGSTNYYASVYSSSGGAVYAISEDIIVAIIVVAIIIAIYRRMTKSKRKNMKTKK
ncbi:MAG: CARDB domain-containing protein [Candidatus Micrarchaeaceae archaeon]